MSDHEDGDARGNRLDRVAPTRRTARRPDGKEALFSTAPTSPRPPQIEVRCRRCGTMSGVGVTNLPALLTPPAIWNPVNGFLWGRCPACKHRARLYVRTGQALRALADMAGGALGRRRDG